MLLHLTHEWGRMLMKLTAKSVVAAASKSPGFVFFLLQTRNGLTGLDWTGLDWTGLDWTDSWCVDKPIGWRLTSHYQSLLVSPLSSQAQSSPAPPRPVQLGSRGGVHWLTGTADPPDVMWANIVNIIMMLQCYNVNNIININIFHSPPDNK